MRVIAYQACENAYMNISWDDIRTVMMLVRHGSLAGAAQALGLNYTTVARRIQRAEDGLGLRLFERLQDGYRPTQAALLFAEHAAQMEQAEHNLMRQIQRTDDRLSGILTVTAPQLLIANFLSPVLDEFSRTYPAIDLRILATSKYLDLPRREADLAIRISDTPGDTLTGLRLLPQQTASFANQSLADNIARDPNSTIDWIVYDGHPTIPKGVSQSYPNNNVRFRLDDMVAIIGAVQAGLGVARLPLFLGRTTSGLVQVPVLPPQPYVDIWAVGHPDVWPSAKPSAFRQILVAHCKANRQLFVG